MQFQKDKTGELDKAVRYIIRKFRPDLDALEFICVWRDKEKIVDGKLVLAEVMKLSNKNRDIFGYDVMLEVDENAWASMSTPEKKKLIFHELQHIQLDHEGGEEIKEDTPKEPEKIEMTAQAMFEKMISQEDYIPGDPKEDKQGRISFSIMPHNINTPRFTQELLHFGLSEEEEALRLFLNHVKDNIGFVNLKGKDKDKS